MFGAFAEALRATTQPCTFLLIVPVLVGVTVARSTWWALVSATAATIVGGWILAANWLVLDGMWLRLSASVAVIAIMGVVAGDRYRALAWASRPVVRVALAASVAFLATLWWRPCVGEELGEILTRSQDGVVGQLPGMTAYMLGALVPAAVLVLVLQAWRPGATVFETAAVAGAAVGVIVAGAIVLGRHDDVVVTLTRWTLS